MIYIGILMVLVAMYIGAGLRIVPQQEFMVVERLGKFCKIWFAGLHFLFVPFDKVSANNNLRLCHLDLYKNDKGERESNRAMDFRDASVDVDIQVWWKIGATEDDIYNFVYKTQDPEDRIEQIIDAFMRPQLQALTINEATCGKKDDGTVVYGPEQIAKDAINDSGIKAALKMMGVYLDENKGCLVSDIDLPNEIAKLRRFELEGEQEARKAEAEVAKFVAIGKSYGAAIKAIMAAAKENGKDISWGEAQDFYLRQRGLDTIAKTGANVTLVSSDVKGLLINVGAGEQKQESGQKEKENQKKKEDKGNGNV